MNNPAFAAFRRKLRDNPQNNICAKEAPKDLIDHPPFTVDGKRDRHFRGDQHVVQMSFTNPLGFCYFGKRVGLRVEISLDSYDDFKDEEKVADALEKLYLRAIYYNEQAGEVPDPPKTGWLITNLSRVFRILTKRAM